MKGYVNDSDLEGEEKRSEGASQSADNRHGEDALGFVVERHLSTHRAVVTDREEVVI